MKSTNSKSSGDTSTTACCGYLPNSVGDVLKDCVSGRGAFQSFTRNDYRIYLGGREGEAVLEHMLPDPRRVLDAGEVFKPGSRGYAVKVEILGKAYFLKCYEARGIFYRVRNAFRISRALASWRSNWGLYTLDLPVPRPVICLESRCLRLLGTAYLLTDFFEGTQTLWEAWDQAGSAMRKQLIAEVANILGRMHGCGAIHGDLKWYNILVRHEGKLEIFLVDLDGSSLHSQLSVARAQKDLERFFRDLKQADEDGSLLSLFLEVWRVAYEQAALLSGVSVRM